MLVTKQNKSRGQSARNPPDKNDENKEIKCFKCKKVGHFARYYRKQSNAQKKDNEESKSAEVTMIACALVGSEKCNTRAIMKSRDVPRFQHHITHMPRSIRIQRDSERMVN